MSDISNGPKSRPTGLFATEAGEVFEQLSGPSSVVPLSRAIVEAAQALGKDGKPGEVEISCGVQLMNSGTPDGPLRAFVVPGDSPIKVTLKGSLVREGKGTDCSEPEQDLQ